MNPYPIAMKNRKTVLLLSIPFSLFGIVQATFVWMGYETGIRSIHYMGYFGVALTVNVAFDVVYRKGRLDERIENQSSNRWIEDSNH